MTDVIHDPRTDWCACIPNGDERCDYRRLADAVIENLDVHDGDEAEATLCIRAVEHAGRIRRWTAATFYRDVCRLIADYSDLTNGVIAWLPFAASLDQLAIEGYGLTAKEMEQS